jgi:hypothetical protein
MKIASAAFAGRFQHWVGRGLYRVANSGRFNYFQNLRQGTDEKGYSLVPFDQMKCIFVHVPKCAGVSVSKSLFGCLGGGHITLKEYKKIFSFHEYGSYFKFTFVRNPWDRLVSAYHFLKQGGWEKNDEAWAEKNLGFYGSFDEFVVKWLNEKNIFSYHHFRPQYHYLCVSGFDVGVDFLGRYERLAGDFREICQRLGVVVELSEINSSNRISYKNYYDPKTRDIVSRVYKKDIDLLGYSF